MLVGLLRMPELSEFINFIAEKSGIKDLDLIEKDIILHRILKEINSCWDGASPQPFQLVLAEHALLPFYNVGYKAPYSFWLIMALMLAWLIVLEKQQKHPNNIKSYNNTAGTSPIFFTLLSVVIIVALFSLASAIK